MANLKYFCVVFLVLTSCDARKLKCEQVVCPDYSLGFNETVQEMAVRFFETEDSTENGICMDGKEKIVAYGKLLGYPGENRCRCLPNEGPYTINENTKVCSSGDVQCPRVVDFYKGETHGERFRRAGKANIKRGITEGCCPAGHVQKILSSFFSKVDKALCFCFPPDDQLVFLEGVPEEE